MNKKDIIIKVSEKLNVTQKLVRNIIDSFLDEITEGLINDEKIVLSNFGTFQKVQTKPYQIYSPVDGSKIDCIGQMRIRFRSSGNLKDKINKKQHF